MISSSSSIDSCFLFQKRTWESGGGKRQTLIHREMDSSFISSGAEESTEDSEYVPSSGTDSSASSSSDCDSDVPDSDVNRDLSWLGFTLEHDPTL